MGLNLLYFSREIKKVFKLINNKLEERYILGGYIPIIVTSFNILSCFLFIHLDFLDLILLSSIIVNVSLFAVEYTDTFFD